MFCSALLKLLILFAIPHIFLTKLTVHHHSFFLDLFLHNRKSRVLFLKQISLLIQKFVLIYSKSMIKLAFLSFLLVIFTVVKGTIYCASCDHGVTVSNCECGNGGSPIPSRQGWCCSIGNSVTSGLLPVIVSLMSAYLATKVN